MSIKVLVVDDTVVFRRLVSDALAAIEGVEVVGAASNGRLALARLAALKPDLITLDIEMPEMNGLEVLEALGACPARPGVIMLSNLTRRGGEMTMRALELGAFDFLTKPETGSAAEGQAWLRSRLAPIIHAFEQRREIHNILKAGGPREAAPASARPARVVRRSSAGPPLVVIGVSTGGPAALARLVPALPADLGAPVFIVQHMPPIFTESLAASLSAKSAIRVKEAHDGEAGVPGCVYLAPGGRQMKLAAGPKGEFVVRITDDPPENNCKPAVDYLFRSVAQHFPGRATAAILTGMGRDGTVGLQLLKRGGCFSIAQDEASCVVFGMPKEAIQSGAVDVVAPLDAIAGAIARSVREGGA
jgi:two-component system chemotaxis response regulator CheB